MLFKSNGVRVNICGEVAQLVEQWTEYPCVAGAIPCPHHHLNPRGTMALTDIEKELQKMASSPEELDKLRKAAVLGLKVAIEDVERVETNAKSGNYLKAYLQALIDVLVPLRAMKSRAEQGQSTHPSSSVF